MIVEIKIIDFRITMRRKATTTTIRDQGMMMRIAIYMMRIEIKMMMRMRMGRQARWREDHVVKNK